MRLKVKSTIVLKGIVLLAGIIVLALCIFVLPAGISSEISGDFDYGPIMLGIYVSAIPFFFALYHSFKILDYIDKNTFFLTPSIRSLKVIKYSAYAICGLYAAGMPYIFFVADRDDAPGVVALGFLILGISFVIANVVDVSLLVIKSCSRT